MKILAIDSSGQTASVALAEDNKLIAEYTLNFKMTHSQTLMPMLEEIRDRIGLDLSAIDYLAVSEGPGSFTGLRIGAATVKGLGLALGKDVAAVPTLEALAANVSIYPGLICPMMDARRGQVYGAVYRFENGKPVVVKEQSALDAKELCASLNELGEPVILLGDGVTANVSAIEETLKVAYTCAPMTLNLQRAGSVALRAFDYVAEGKVQTAMEHKPEYLRVSSAERERAERLERSKEA